MSDSYISTTLDNIFNLHNCIGSGSSSLVFKASFINHINKPHLIAINDSRNLAVKIFKPRKSKDEIVKSMLKEVNIMKQLNHPNILKALAYNLNGTIKVNSTIYTDIVYLVMEYSENRDLFDLLVQSGRPLSEPFARHYMKEILKGLKHIHDQGLCHRDLKLENILLGSSFEVKLGDFGFSEYTNEGGLLTLFSGTHGYSSPELVMSEGYSGELNDVFSLGVVLYNLVQLKRPFDHGRRYDKHYRYFYLGDTTAYWNSMKKNSLFEMTDELVDLLNKMLCYKDRLNLSGVLNHEWLRKDDLPTEEELKEDMLLRVDKRLDVNKEEEINFNGLSFNNDCYFIRSTKKSISFPSMLSHMTVQMNHISIEDLSKEISLYFDKKDYSLVTKHEQLDQLSIKVEGKETKFTITISLLSDKLFKLTFTNLDTITELEYKTLHQLMTEFLYI